MAYNSASELEKLISNCEFENRQYVKLIEHEDQLIESLQEEIKCKEEETKRLQEAVSQLDVDSKQCHKQFTINRDNVDSLKKTHVVLTEHVTAMDSKLEVMEAKIQAESQEHIQHLQRYQTIWDSYAKQYESIPLVLELRKQELLTDDLSKTNEENEQYLHDAKRKIAKLRDSEMCNMGTTEFILALAKIRIDTKQLMLEVEERKSELTQLRQSLQCNIQAASDINNEANLQKLTNMRLADKDLEEVVTVESKMQYKQIDMASPMISMLAEREDEVEAMQTDVVSPDQISLQFAPDEQETTQLLEITNTQVIEDTGRKPGTEATAEKENNRNIDIQDNTQGLQNMNVCAFEDGQSSTVSWQKPSQLTSDNSSKTVAPTSTQFTHDLSSSLVTQRHGQTNQPTQAPFVTYKATGQESVQIHMIKPVSVESEIDNQNKVQHQTMQHCQSLPANQTQANNRTQIPQISATRPPRPPCFKEGVSPHLGRPQILQPQLNRASEDVTQRAGYRKPVLQQITRPSNNILRPGTLLSRQPGSRLPILHMSRSPIVHSQHHSLGILPNRTHGPVAASQNASSPLQITSQHNPPILYQQKQESPLQLPGQYRHILQKTNSADSAGIQSTSIQQNLVPHRFTSPPNIGQPYAQRKPSPLTHGEDNVINTAAKFDNASLKTTVSSQGNAPINKNTVRHVIQSSPRVSSKAGSPKVHSPPTSNAYTRVALHNNPQTGMDFVKANIQNNLQTTSRIPNSEGNDTYFMKLKDESAERKTDDDPDSRSPHRSPIDHAGTPEKNDVRRPEEETLSPFDNEKHRQALADMKKSPGQPQNLYKVPAKRGFSEMEGSTVGYNETMQQSVFGMASLNVKAGTPLDGSGDISNSIQTGQTKESKSDTNIIPNTEVESAFQFFDSFSKQAESGDNSEGNSGNIFCFGGGDFSKNEIETSAAPFSMFGSRNDDDVSSGFSFDFNNTENKEAKSPGNGGENFLSLFGRSEDQDNSNSNFKFSFGISEAKSPSFSFF